MMKFILLFSLLFTIPATAQSLSGVNGDCMIGGEQALTSGLPSTATQQIGTTNVNAGAGVQASFPLCLVSVYATGTLSKATIYSDNNPAPTVLVNPFTANVDGSFTFFAASGCYDVVMSTGTGPALPYSRSLTDVCIGGGGSGGSTDVGTPNQIIKALSANVFGNSSGFDDGTNPTQWPNGVSFMARAGFSIYTNDTNIGTVLNHLVMVNGTDQVVQNTSTTSILGIADVGSGNVGKVQVARIAKEPCVFDGQTTANDWVVAGTPADQCHDAGATKPTGIMVIGRVITVNSGAGTLATVDLFTGDTNPAGVNSGAVNPCATPGAIAFYALAGITVSCDPSLLTDGAGNGTGQSWTLLGPGAGFVALGQGTVPSLSQANAAYWAGPATVASSFLTLVPSAVPGGTTECIHGTKSGTTVTLSYTGADCGSGSGTVTSVGLTVNSTSPSGIFTVTGSPVTTSGTLNFNLAGNSGGVPYFSSGTVLSSSSLLTAHGVVTGGGSATSPGSTSAGAADTIFMGNDAGTGSDPAFKAGPSGGTNGCAGASDTPTYNTSTHAWGCHQITSGSTQGPYPITNLVPDASGNVFWQVTALTNWRAGHWEWVFNPSFPVDIFGSLKMPHVIPSGTCKIVLDTISANDGTAGHTMTFKIGDQLVSSTYNVGAFSYTATQNFTTTATAYAPTTLTFNCVSTPTVDSLMVIDIQATAASGLANNVLMNGMYVEWQ